MYSEVLLKAKGLMRTVKQVSKSSPKLRPLILSPAWLAFSYNKTCVQSLVDFKSQ